jgi:hypothetical protein
VLLVVLLPLLHVLQWSGSAAAASCWPCLAWQPQPVMLQLLTARFSNATAALFKSPARCGRACCRCCCCQILNSLDEQ